MQASFQSSFKGSFQAQINPFDYTGTAFQVAQNDFLVSNEGDVSFDSEVIQPPPPPPPPPLPPQSQEAAQSRSLKFK